MKAEELLGKADQLRREGRFGEAINAYRAAAALPDCPDEIKKISNDLVTDKEFERSKVQLKSSIKMGLESSSSTAEVLARQNLIYGKSLSINEIIEKIDAVTKESIRDVADKIFKTNPTYTLLGAIDKHMEYDELQKALA